MSFGDKIRRILRILCIRIHRMRKEKKVRIMLVVICLALGVVLGIRIGSKSGWEKGTEHEKKNTVSVEQEMTAKIEKLQAENERLSEQIAEQKKNPKKKDLPWNLTLVNWENSMEKGYRPKLEEIESGYYVDVRIAGPLREMLAAAKKDGMRIEICSAYRSVKRQEQVFNESVRDRLYAGMGYWDAYADTLQSVNAPGTSEHGLGVAVDLVATDYTELDEGQAKTKEAIWLQSHCHEYGFILRYPPEKTKETGIIYEPWHYRYVGVEIATEIMNKGITLETYLKDYE